MEDEMITIPSDPSRELCNHNKKSDATDGSCWTRVMEKIFPGGYCRELRETMKIGWALIISQVCQLYVQPIATMFGGHLGKVELDAIALSNTLINILGNSIIIGFSTAFDTVFSQTFGSGNYEMVGIYLQKSLILTFLCLLPCYALHLNIEPILMGLGQDKEVSRLVGQYLFYFMPGMFCLFMWTTLRKFTQCQSIVAPHIFIILFGHVVHAVLQYIFLYQFGLGIIGSAAAQAILFFLLFILTIIYTVRSASFKLSWKGFDRRCLHGWGDLGLLGVYGMLMICLEWWAFEITIFLAGLLGMTELAAQSVAFNLNSLCFAASSGVVVATSISIGQLLGANEELRAKTSARVGMSITFVTACLWFIFYTVGRFEVPKMFTNDRAIIDMVSGVLPIIAVLTLGDSITMIGRGIFRSVGKQFLGMVVILVSYYVLGLPLAIGLTFLTSMGIKGLWLGLTVSMFVSAVVYFLIINIHLDWKKLADEAQIRARGTASGCKSNKTEDNDEETNLVPASDDSEVHKKKVTKSLLVKRTLVVVTFCSILLAGITARILTGDSYRQCNYEATRNDSTAFFNSTLSIGLDQNSTWCY